MMKFLILFILILSSNPVFSAKIARVNELSGMSFVQRADGKTLEIYKDFNIETNDLVFISEDSHMKITDFYDREFVFSGGSEFLLREDMIELRKGSAWIASNRDEAYMVTTANSHIIFAMVEGIVSYNDQTLRTDLSVAQGNAYFRNIEIDDIKVDVSGGQFSYIQESYNNGIPRAPTIIGADSFIKLTKQFKTKPEKEISVKDNAKRSIASVKEEEIVSPVNRGELTIIKPDPKRSIASVPTKAKSRKLSTQKKVNKAPIRFFGVKKVQIKTQKNKIAKENILPKTKKRSPASINISTPVQNSFEQSLGNHLNRQKRHSSERLELIDELKSVSEDFQKEY